MSSDTWGLLFLLTLCLVVGTSALLVLGALGEALQGKFSPRGFTATVSIASLLSVGACVLLGLTQPMVCTSVALTTSAAALLLLPIPRSSDPGPARSTRQRLAIAVTVLLAAALSFATGTGWWILKQIGMSDGLATGALGQSLSVFANLCTGLTAGVLLALTMRIRDEGRQSDPCTD